MSRIRTALLALIALAFVAPTAVEAQRGWDISAYGDVGYMFSVRTMGQNNPPVQTDQIYQIFAELQDALVTSAGVEIGFPNRSISVRARVNQTVDGSVSSFAGSCEFGNFDYCRNVDIDVTMRSFLADLRVLRGTPGDRVRPVMTVGGGIRSWSFGNFADCSTGDSFEWSDDICPRANEITQNVSSSPVLLFGFGIQSDLGPLQLSVNGDSHVSAYSGGVGNASGNTMLDVMVGVSGSLRIF